MLFYCVWLILLAALIFTDWIRRRHYFNEVFHLLNGLDKPYLISEIMPDSWRLEDRLYKKLLRKSNKSVIDAIHHLETERTEYKEFIENWIHEVKLPLTSMNLLCDNHKKAFTQEDILRLKANLSKLENDMDKALYYARSDTVYQDYMIREISLHEAVLDAIRQSKPYLTQNNVRIELQTEEAFVYCDDKWLGFIINQILLNAVKYRKKDGCTISIYTKKNDGCTTLTIEDNGIGIREEELCRIFNKGFTGSNGRSNRHSTGIGLYLCLKLSKKLGISLDAESKEGEYTRLNLTFPDGRSYFGRE